MSDVDESYAFPWGFHIGDLDKEGNKMPLFTPTQDGGFCLLYDKASERKVDNLLESLSLELLSSMPHESLAVDLFDFGKKKFYNLSPLQYMHIYTVSHSKELIETKFQELEDLIVSRHTDLLCCNRPTITEHNQKSKLKQQYHLVLINLENFPTEAYALRKINNFVESAVQAGVYVIAFGYLDLEQSQNENIQTILKHFKILRVKEGNFEINEEIFEFMELLDDHTFESLNLDKSSLLQTTLAHADLESFMNPDLLTMEENTRVE